MDGLFWYFFLSRMERSAAAWGQGILGYCTSQVRIRAATGRMTWLSNGCCDSEVALLQPTRWAGQQAAAHLELHIFSYLLHQLF
jgi:hypothetical protein